MYWYSFMVSLEDVQTQRNGMIAIIFATGDSIRKRSDSGIYLKVSRLFDAVPHKNRGIHLCYEDETLAYVFPNPIKVIQLTVDTLTRTKFRVHHGTFDVLP